MKENIALLKLQLSLFKRTALHLIMNYRSNRWIFSNIPLERLVGYSPKVDDRIHEVKFKDELYTRLYEHFPVLTTKNLYIHLDRFLKIFNKFKIDEGKVKLDIDDNGLYFNIPIADLNQVIPQVKGNVKGTKTINEVAEHLLEQAKSIKMMEVSLVRWKKFLQNFIVLHLAVPELSPDGLRIYCGKVLDPISLRTYTELPVSIRKNIKKPVSIPIQASTIHKTKIYFLNISVDLLPKVEDVEYHPIRVPLVDGQTGVSIYGYANKTKRPFEHKFIIWPEHNVLKGGIVFENDQLSVHSMSPGSKWFPYASNAYVRWCQEQADANNINHNKE